MTANPQDPGAPDGRPVEPFPSLADGRRSSSKRGAAGRRVPKARTPEPEPVPTEAPPLQARRPAGRKRPQRTVEEPAVVAAPVVAEPEPDWSLDDTQEIPVVAGAPVPVEEPLVLVPGTLAVEGIPTPVEVAPVAEAPPVPDAATEAAEQPPVVVEPDPPEPEPAPPAAIRPPKRPKPPKAPKPPRAPKPPKVRRPRRLPAWLTRRPALRLNAIPVRVFATALVVALAIFAIGVLRDDEPGDQGTETVAGPDPVLAPVPSEASASPSASPSPSPSSASPSSDKPKGDDEPKNDPPKKDDPPSGGGGGKDPRTGSFRIKSVSSGLCLDEADLGDSTVVQKSCSSSPLSAEGLESLGGGDYYLTTYHPQHHEGCISSKANGVGNGFIGDACTGDASQIFSLDEVSDGVYRIRLVDNGTCIAVDGDGAPVSASCGNGKNQRFIFV